MNSKKATELAYKEYERLVMNGKIDSFTMAQVSQRAMELADARNRDMQRISGLDSLSSKRYAKNAMHGMTMNHVSIPVIRDMITSTAGEFLSEGEDIWSTLRNESEKMVAIRVYNEIRKRLGRGIL